MDVIERKVLYFAQYGSQNTEKTIEAVKDRIENDGIKTIVVASTTGETGVKFSEVFRDRARLIIVSHREMNSLYKQKITELGGTAMDKTHLPLHTEGMDDIRESFRTLGQGFKVAVEIILIAADKGALNLYEDVISVGGTNRGSDTAIIARATLSKEILDKDENKKLEIREIVAMPLKKKWW